MCWRALSLTVGGETMTPMIESERAVLAFEEQHPRNDRAKEAAIRMGVAKVTDDAVRLRTQRRFG